MVGTFIAKFINRSREEMHQKVLRALKDRGPCPMTNLAYRAEMSDKQIQSTVSFLEEKKLVLRTPLSSEVRLKFVVPFSLSSKDLIRITTKGSKYLDMLDRIEAQIDWSKFDEEMSWRNGKGRKRK
jgi:predicted transcriptional regulator